MVMQEARKWWLRWWRAGQQNSGVNPTVNTGSGGGGGGGSNCSTGGSGGSGIVIVRYATLIQSSWCWIN